MEEKENDCVKYPLFDKIKDGELEDFKDYIPVKEYGIKVDDSLNIDIVAIDQKFGLKGYENSYDDVVAIECKYQTNINYAIQTALAQAILYQTSFKKVYIAVNKDGPGPSYYVKNILERTGIGLITVKTANNKETSKEIKIGIPANSSKSNFFCESLYEKNTAHRAFLIAAFARACDANGYSKRNLYIGWDGSKKNLLHIWMEMPIIKDKLRIGCAYSLKLNENEPGEVEEAALRLSIRGLDPDKSIKEQIAEEFHTKDNGKKRGDNLEWDYNLKDLMKTKKNEDIEEK